MSPGAYARITRKRHPIYAQYDGFIRTSDDRLVLAFGYHNLNQVDVTIEAGDANRFLTGAPDRRQPTVFEVGRHRFACVMVVPEPFDGDIQWQVFFAGHTSTTTARVLDPLYALEEGSARQVLEKLGSGAAPDGRCVTSEPD